MGIWLVETKVSIYSLPSYSLTCFRAFYMMTYWKMETWFLLFLKSRTDLWNYLSSWCWLLLLSLLQGWSKGYLLLWWGMPSHVAFTSYLIMCSKCVLTASLVVSTTTYWCLIFFLKLWSAIKSLISCFRLTIITTSTLCTGSLSYLTSMNTCLHFDMNIKRRQLLKTYHMRIIYKDPYTI